MVVSQAEIEIVNPAPVLGTQSEYTVSSEHSASSSPPSTMQ